MSYVIDRLKLQRVILSLLANPQADRRLGQGVAYIDMFQHAPENGELCLTPAGSAAVRDEEYTPDDPSGYLDKLARDLPALSPIAMMYMREAIRSYAATNYLSTTVMLGVA